MNSHPHGSGDPIGDSSPEEAPFDLLLDALLTEYQLQGCEIGLSFVPETEIADLNRKFRGISKATDVLAFPRVEWTPPIKPGDASQLDINTTPLNKWLGDVIISAHYAQREADKRSQSLDNEIKTLIVHGFLHLCGYDHQTPSDAEIMFAEQERLLKSVVQNCRIPSRISDYERLEQESVSNSSEDDNIV